MIRVENLSFTYPGAKQPALESLSFEVADGEIFGLLGPSGAGKSTTQSILTKILSGWSGHIEVMGRPLERWRRKYFEQIGVSFELPNHYEKLTARENLDFFRALYSGPTDTPEALLSAVGLDDAIDARVSSFSKGMKNRLTLARSLVARPKLWFLDEPTSGLDPVNARKVMELVETRRTSGTTCILTTHDMHVAQTLCDRVGFVVGGQLFEVDAPAALLRRFGRREVRVERAGEDQPSTFPLDGLGDNADFLSFIASGELRSIHSQEATLEEVFIQVTGRALK